MEPEDEGAEGKRREGVTAGEEFILLFSFTSERERGGGEGEGVFVLGKSQVQKFSLHRRTLTFLF